jgi:hypothetical protein
MKKTSFVSSTKQTVKQKGRKDYISPEEQRKKQTKIKKKR